MTGAEMLIAIVRVAGLALVFGAGIPVLFSLGMRCLGGSPVRDAQGAVVADTEAKPVMKVLGWAMYALLAALILVAILWLAKDTLNHYFGFNLFPGLSSSH